jgi:hypothetical protein
MNQNNIHVPLHLIIQNHHDGVMINMLASNAVDKARTMKLVCVPSPLST